VVASNQSALPEVVEEAGLLVNPRDVEAIAAAMSRILSESTLRHHLAQIGLKQAAKFTWPGMAAKLLNLYQKIVEERRHK